MLATLAVLCAPQILNLKENLLGFSNSIFALFLWGILLYVINRALEMISWADKRANLLSGSFAFLFSIAMLFGVQLDTAQNVDFKNLLLWISIPVYTALFTILVKAAWTALEKAAEQREMLHETKDFQEPGPAEWKINLCVFAGLLLCWLPVFLAVYPGFFVYDAQDEYIQVATRSFTTHHPLPHVLLLGGILCAVHKVTDSYNFGIACYTVFQMLVLSGVFTYFLSYLRKKHVKKAIRVGAFLYFAFFPVIVMYTLCSAKDAIFTAALLMLSICILETELNPETFLDSRKNVLLCIGSAMTMMLFRKNGVYAFIVFAILWMIIRLKSRKNTGNKKILLILAFSLAGYVLINGALETAFHADSSENQELLTVPIQQLTRTYKFNKEAFSAEDVEILHEVLSEEALSMYNAKLSDPVKYRFDNRSFAADKMRYISLWARIGLKKPLSYLNAWLMTSYGFWYPDTVMDVYAGNSVFTFTYEDCSYFGYEVELPGVRESKMPWLDEVYRKLSLDLTKEKIPVVSMLFSPGCLFWCFAFAFVYALYRRNYGVLMPYSLILLVWLTVILGPTYLPRYVIILWFALPLLISAVFEEERFVVKAQEKCYTKE